MFPPFAGTLDFVPDILLDESIKISFESEENREDHARYTVLFILYPGSFNFDWFQLARKNKVVVRETVGRGIEMTLDDFATMPASPLWLEIAYFPGKEAKVPSEGEAKELFEKMLDKIELWLVAK